jgi:hypothetical protein
MGERNAWRSCGPGRPSKEDHIVGFGGQGGTVSIIIEDECASPSRRICILSANRQPVSHRHTSGPYTGEVGIMMGSVTKKDVPYCRGNTLYLQHTMSLRLVEGGERGLPAKAASLALQCSSCTQAAGTAVDWRMVGSHARRVKFFYAMPHIFLQHHGLNGLCTKSRSLIGYFRIKTGLFGREKAFTMRPKRSY